MQLLTLYWSFFQVGLFTIGGGLASLPLIQSQVVESHQWLSLTEFTDLIVIAQMTPGPIAINAATFIGMQLEGILGAIIATLGFITPSCIIVSLVAWVYFKYKDLTLIDCILHSLRPAVVAMIASAGLSILILTLWGENTTDINLTSMNYSAIILMVISFVVLKKWKPNPIFVILGSGIIGGIIYTFF
ncbi:MAG: chromate transporter [Peptostreptococcales bacterium]